MSASLGFTNNARPPVTLSKVPVKASPPVQLIVPQIRPVSSTFTLGSMLRLLNMAALIFVSIYGGLIIGDIFPALAEPTELTYIRVQLVSAVAISGLTVLDKIFYSMIRRINGVKSLLQLVDLLMYTLMSVIVGFFLSSRYICPQIDATLSGLPVHDICLRVENTSYVLVSALAVRMLATVSTLF